MSCCGEREKIGEERPEQRWDYIVGAIREGLTVALLTVSFPESVRLQIHLLLCTPFLRNPVHIALDRNCCVRRGCIHRCKSSILQPLVRSSQTCYTLLHRALDFRGMHYPLFGSLGLSMVEGSPCHEKRYCSS